MLVKHTHTHIYVKYIKIYVCEINMPFTYTLSFWKSAFLKQNSINEYNTNRTKKELNSISVMQSFFVLSKNR